MADQTEIVYCPNDNEEKNSSVGLADYLFHVENQGFSEYGGSHDIPFEEGPRCRIADPSHTDGDSAGVGADYWLGNSQGCTLDGPDSFVIEFEDASDFDWTDCVVFVNPKPDGTLHCKFCVKQAGYTFQLKHVDGSVIFSPFKPGDEWTVEGGVKSSYGMNNRAGRLGTGDAWKIAAVEYQYAVAHVVGPGADSSTWPDRVRPRHRGLMNVLFYDGHISTRTPGSVDPRVTALHNELWNPRRDLELTGS